MTSVRLTEVYEKTKEIIFQIHKDNLENEVVSANVVLTTLLYRFIEEKNPDSEIAGLFLDRLSLKGKHWDGFFAKPRSVDDVSCLIHYLNKDSARIQKDSDLANLLGAFFSVYSHYRSKLNLNLQSKLPFQDNWNDFLEKRMDKIFENANVIELGHALSTLRRVGMLHAWVPEKHRDQVKGFIIDFLESLHKPEAQDTLTLHAIGPVTRDIITLSKWFSPSSLCISLLALIKSKNENIRALACCILVQLKPILLANALQEEVDTAIHQLIELARKKELSPKIVCKSIMDLASFISCSAWPGIVDWLKMLLDEEESKPKNMMIKVVGRSYAHFPEQTKPSLIASLLDSLPRADSEMGLAICTALVPFQSNMQLNQMQAVINYLLAIFHGYHANVHVKLAALEVVFKFDKWMQEEKRREIRELLRATIYSQPDAAAYRVSIHGLLNHLPQESYRICCNLLETIVDEKAELEAKIAALEGVVVLFSVFPSDKIYALIQGLSSIVSNKEADRYMRESAAHALGVFSKKIPSDALLINLTKLTSLAKDKSEPLGFRILIIKQIYTLRKRVPPFYECVFDALQPIVTDSKEHCELVNEAAITLMACCDFIPDTIQARSLSDNKLKLTTDLMKLLENENSDVRKNTLKMIPIIKELVTHSILASLIKCLNDKDEEVRAQLYMTLNDFVPDLNQDQKIAIMCHLYDSQDASNRLVAVLPLINIYDALRRETTTSSLKQVTKEAQYEMPDELIELMVKRVL